MHSDADNVIIHGKDAQLSSYELSCASDSPIRLWLSCVLMLSRSSFSAHAPLFPLLLLPQLIHQPVSLLSHPCQMLIAQFGYYYS